MDAWPGRCNVVQYAIRNTQWQYRTPSNSKERIILDLHGWKVEIVGTMAMSNQEWPGGLHSSLKVKAVAVAVKGAFLL